MTIGLVLSTVPAFAQRGSSAVDLQRARTLLAHHQIAAADTLLRSVLLREPSDPDAWTLIGVVQVEQGLLGEAEKSLRKSLELDPQSAAAQTNLGRLLLEQHRSSEALPYLESALRHGGGSNELRDMTVSAVEAVALQQRAAGDWDGALATLLATRAEVPRSFRLLVDLSILEDDLRLYRDADRDVHQARLMRPNDLKALYAEARVKMDLQDMVAAEQAMRAYLNGRPDDATAHYGLGRILQIAQHSTEAKEEFERSIELAPNQAESYYQIGQMALDSGDLAAAQQECKKALEHDPKHGGALAAYGIAAFRLKQYPEALQSLQAAIAAAPDYAPAHYYYGLALARTGEKESSERELRAATELADRQNRKDAQHLQLAPAAQGASPHP